VLVSELPLPGTLRILVSLRILIDLRRPFADVLASAPAHNMWVKAEELAPRARVVAVTDPAGADHVDEVMLAPFASHRHQERARQASHDAIRHFARHGNLHVVHLDGEAVAARIAYSYRRNGSAHFMAWRFGYPREVFSDQRRFTELNALNAYLALREAHASGHAFFDFGVCPAQPENGILQYKRMRGGALSTAGCHQSLFLRVPREVAPEFYWSRPLFSVERGKLILNVGLPSGRDEELIGRVGRLYGFLGLWAVRLHASGTVNEKVMSACQRRYGGQTHILIGT